MAESFGVDTGRLKIVVFVYSALLASLSGWLYAHFLRYVSPAPFGINAGIDYLFMAVIGGSQHVWGAVVGAAVMTLLQEWLKDFLPHLLGRNGNYEIIVFGLLVVLLLHRTSDGLLPFPRPDGRERQSVAGRPARSAAAAAAAESRARAKCSCRSKASPKLRRAGRGERPVVQGEGRGDRRPDRTQRRRQEHVVQFGHREC